MNVRAAIVFLPTLLLLGACKGKPVQPILERPGHYDLSVVALSGLGEEAVKSALEERRPEITSCYLNYQRVSNGTARLTFKFKVEPSGKIARAALVARSTKNPTFENCVLKQVKATRFPSLDVPAVTEVPTATFDFFPPIDAPAAK